MDTGKSILERLQTRKLTWPKGIEEFIFQKWIYGLQKRHVAELILLKH